VSEAVVEEQQYLHYPHQRREKADSREGRINETNGNQLFSLLDEATTSNTCNMGMR
jgi:hypothetical protein